MKPTTVSCEESLPLAPEEIAGQILDLTRWPNFRGYGPIPGIKSAEFEVRTPGVIGTRIRVVNRDGSRHIEEIVKWQPERRIQLKVHEFSPPLSWLATRFVETLEFQCVDGGTNVERTLQLHPTSILARLPLRVLSFFLKRAMTRHLREMRGRT